GYRRVRMVMFPAYLRLSEPQVERRYYGFPFVATYGGPGGSGFRVLPFYGTREIVGEERTSYVLWPFHIRSERLVPGYGCERRRVLEFLWRRQTLVNEASGHQEMVTTMFPWLRSEQDDWRAFGQAPALFDSLLPKNRGLLTLWAPLYNLVRWDTRPDGAHDWNLLWGLAAREDGRLRGRWYLELPHGG